MAENEVQIKLAEPHAAQKLVLEQARRFNVLACGRRWGKTKLGTQIVVKPALEGLPVGWFAPTYKFQSEAWDGIIQTLRPLGNLMTPKKAEGRIELATGGRIDFWSLERDNAGRGMKYAVAAIDEAAIVRDLMRQWNESIRPTLADYRGKAFFFSTPRGMNDFHGLWAKGQKERSWKSWQMPTVSNPYISEEEILAAQEDMPADAFAQEFLAEFLADASNPFGIEAIRSNIAKGLSPHEVCWWGFDLAKSMDWTVAIGLDRSGNCAAFQRWQGDWKSTTARISAMIGHTPALLDSTGVGDPIVELVQEKCPAAEGFKFNSQSKQQLMEGLALAIQRNDISYPDGPIVAELETFQYEYRPAGVRYSAPPGLHDDCVMALALAHRCRMLSAVPLRLDIGGADSSLQTHWAVNTGVDVDAVEQSLFWQRIDDDRFWSDQ